MSKYKMASYCVDVANKVGINSAILLNYLCKVQQCKPNYWEGYFCATIQEIQDNTGLSYDNQKTAINKLKSFGIIDVSRRGIQGRNYFKIITN